MSNAQVDQAHATRGGSGLGRSLRRILIVVVALILVIWLAASWYFSGLVKGGALDVEPYEPIYRLTTIEVSAEQITVDDSAAVWEELRSDNNLALAWPGGFGLISGAALAPQEDRVTRSFELVDGSLPKVGQDLALIRNLILDPATDPEIEQVTYPTPQGDYPAWFVPAPAVSERSATWAVLVHGKGASPAELWRMSLATRALGMQSLLITYRNDEGATPDPSASYGYGQTEWPDLAAAVEYAKAQGAEQVVLGAASMGGAIVASYLRETDDDIVKAAVLDAPALDLNRVIAWGAEQQPVAPPAPITWLAKLFTSWRTDVDWNAVNYVDDPEWADVPILVLHTQGDKTVPFTSSEDFVRQAPDAQLETFEGEHVESYNDDPQRYLDLVTEFLEPLT